MPKGKPDILATPKGKIVTLADGKEYQLSPMNLNVLANMEEEFDCNLDELGDIFQRRTTTNFRRFLKILMTENYPDLSLEDVGRLVLIETMEPLFKELQGYLSGKPEEKKKG